ncbi:MAG: hypothetical protein VKQ33_03640 [Candidatus Sericytochromatia bacterium]|nr:hypothetical protein [Candidatus Sericytochromatia bacterium]
MTQAAPSWSALVSWVEWALWAVVVGIVLTRCVLPSVGEAPRPTLERVRVTTDGRPLLVAFDGSR